MGVGRPAAGALDPGGDGFPVAPQVLQPQALSRGPERYRSFFTSTTDFEADPDRCQCARVANFRLEMSLDAIRTTAIGIICKAPRAGASKTRLIPALGA